MIGIIGTGGHSKVISDIFRRKDSENQLIYFTSTIPLDASWKKETIKFDEPEVLLQYRSNLKGWHVAIGTPDIRKKRFDYLEKNHFPLINAVHDKSIIAGSSEIGSGTSVMAGAVINPDVTVGKGSIINTTASIDHDCRIGNFVNISPGCKLAGGVHVGDLTELGTGAVAIPNIKIGSNCVIGAGAVVIHDIPDHSIAVGVPAKVISRKK